MIEILWTNVIVMASNNLAPILLSCMHYPRVPVGLDFSLGFAGMGLIIPRPGSICDTASQDASHGRRHTQFSWDWGPVSQMA